MVFTYLKRIYGYECDSYGHLNNSSYLQLFEAARSEAMVQMNTSIHSLREKNIHIYLTRIEIDYVKGIHLEDVISVNTWIESGNRLRALWMQEVFNSKQELCCRASVYGVFVRDGKPFRLPPEELEVFRPFVRKELS